MNIITKDDSSLSSDTTSWLSRRKFNKDCSSYAFHPNWFLHAATFRRRLQS
jgi:hypothetical protein